MFCLTCTIVNFRVETRTLTFIVIRVCSRPATIRNLLGQVQVLKVKLNVQIEFEPHFGLV